MSPFLALRFFVEILSRITKKDHLKTESLLEGEPILAWKAFLWKAYLKQEGKTFLEQFSKLEVDQRFRSRLLRRPEVSNRFSLLQLILVRLSFSSFWDSSGGCFLKSTNDREPTRASEFKTNLISGC